MTRALAVVRGAACCRAGACTSGTCMLLPAPEACALCLWRALCHERPDAIARARACSFFPRRFVRDRELAP